MKQLGISFASIFLLFFYESISSHIHNSLGKSLAPALNDSPGIMIDYDYNKSCPLVRVYVKRASSVAAAP